MDNRQTGETKFYIRSYAEDQNCQQMSMVNKIGFTIMVTSSKPRVIKKAESLFPFWHRLPFKFIMEAGIRGGMGDWGQGV